MSNIKCICVVLLKINAILVLISIIFQKTIRKNHIHIFIIYFIYFFPIEINSLTEKREIRF